MKFPNCVQNIRIKQLLSREELAQLVGVTRQTIGLIEAGRVNPSTSVAIRLAKALGTSVEFLFDASESIQTVRFYAPDGSHETGKRVVGGIIRGHQIARPLSTGEIVSPFQLAHGLARDFTPGFAQIEWLQQENRHHKALFISGCDLGLGLLANQMSRTASTYEGIWFQSSNDVACNELVQGVTHVAAIHTASPSTLSETTFPFPVRRFVFSTGQLGWVVNKGNPKRFHGPEDLSSGRFRIVNRAKGAGSRKLLESQLQWASIDESTIPGFDEVVRGHREVAYAVQSNLADVGIAHEGVCALASVDFIPIQTETCILIIPEETFASDPVQVLMDSIHSDAFRRDLRAMGPYDVQQMGSRISDSLRL